MDDAEARNRLELCNLMRLHISIRNRSLMRRVHHSCFIGSDAVDFMVQQGIADTRKDAVCLGQRMYEDKLLRHVTDTYGFRDAYFYYRFAGLFQRAHILSESSTNFHRTLQSQCFLQMDPFKMFQTPHMWMCSHESPVCFLDDEDALAETPEDGVCRLVARKHTK